MTYILDGFIGDVNFKPQSINYNNNHLYWNRRQLISPSAVGVRKYSIPGLGSQNIAVNLFRAALYGQQAIGNKVTVLTSATNLFNNAPYSVSGAVQLQEGSPWLSTDVSLTPPLPQYAGQQWEAFPWAYNRLDWLVGRASGLWRTLPNYPFTWTADPWDTVLVTGLSGVAATCFFAVRTALVNTLTVFGYVPVPPVSQIEFTHVEMSGTNLWVTGYYADSNGNLQSFVARLVLTPGTFGPSFGTATVQAIFQSVNLDLDNMSPRYAANKLYLMPQHPVEGAIPQGTIRRFNATTLVPDDPPWAGFYNGFNALGVRITDITPSLLNSYYLTATNYTAGGTTSTTAVYLIDGNLDTVVDGGTISNFAGATVAVDPNFDLWINPTGWANDYRIAHMIRQDDYSGWSYGLLAF